MKELLKDAYINGYERGHNDTVESLYADAEGCFEDYLLENAVVGKPPLCDVLAEIKSELYGVHGLVGLLCYNRVEKILSKYFA